MSLTKTLLIITIVKYFSQLQANTIFKSQIFLSQEQLMHNGVLCLIIIDVVNICARQLTIADIFLIIFILK